MVCNDPILPIPSGIGPINWLWDKFKKFNPFRSVISLGISPNNLLLDRSILVTKPRMFPYSSPLFLWVLATIPYFHLPCPWPHYNLKRPFDPHVLVFVG